jgi:hypothetical protein
MRALQILASVTLAATLIGCFVSVGPVAFSAGSNARTGRALPASPEHGASYLNPDDGTELIFDGGKGLFGVPELPSHFYHEGVYHRRERKGWVHSSHLDGPWHPTETADLPPGLR